MRNYISKINDRNLQRKRESGLTTYALFSILLIAIYKAFEFYPLIPIRVNFWQVFIQLTYSINIIISILIIYLTYSDTYGHLSSSRVILKSSANDTLLEDALSFFILFGSLAVNVSATIYMILTAKYYNWYLIIVSIFLILFFIVVLYINFKDRKINQVYEIFDGTGKVDTDRDIVSVVFYLLSTASLIFSVYHIYNSNVPFSKLNTFLFGAICYSIPLIIIKIIDLQKNDTFSSALENLEYEINVRNLNDDDIRERLQKNYMGFLLIEWVAYNLKELDKFLNIVQEKKNEVVVLKKELVAIDKSKYPIEHEGRNEKITEKENQIDKLTAIFFKSKLNEIESIWTDRKLESNELRELSKLYNKMKSEEQKLVKK